MSSSETASWKSHLNADPVEWLLEESHPSVRYFTLRWILDLNESDPVVQVAEEVVAQSGPVQKLLAKQRPEGYWGSDPRPHHGAKTHLKLLMFLGYRGDDQVRKGMEYLINGCLRSDGAYVIEMKDKQAELPCHGGDLLHMMLWFGYGEDPRALRLLDWLVGVQGGDGIWPCPSKVRPFSCLWATADVLRAYNALPDRMLKAEVVQSRQRAIEQLLASNITQYGKGKPSERWFQFGYPLRFDSDVLEVLELLAPYISPDEEGIQESLALVLSKQTDDGRWLCEKHPKGGKWMDKFIGLEPIGEPSRWVTLHCLRMLKTVYGSKP
jgi:hypothetical protein